MAGFLARIAELRDAVAEHHEALVDVVGLFERLALTVRLLGHLAAGQVDKVDLAVTAQVDARLGSLSMIFKCFLLNYDVV